MRCSFFSNTTSEFAKVRALHSLLAGTCLPLPPLPKSGYLPNIAPPSPNYSRLPLFVRFCSASHTQLNAYYCDIQPLALHPSTQYLFPSPKTHPSSVTSTSINPHSQRPKSTCSTILTPRAIPTIHSLFEQALASITDPVPVPVFFFSYPTIFVSFFTARYFVLYG